MAARTDPQRAKRTRGPVGAKTSARQLVTGVEVVDAPEGREHQNRDLVGMVGTTAGILVMLALSIYAQGTTAGVTQDVQSITEDVRVVLVATVGVLRDLVTLVLPVVVLATLLLRRQFALTLQGLAAGLVGCGLAYVATWLIELTNYGPLIQGMSGGGKEQLEVAVAPLVALMAGLLTAVGPRSRRPVLSVAWNLLWVALAAWVLTGGSTLPAVAVTVLLGRLAGQALRYLVGVSTDRASGRGLVEGIRGAGLEPARIVRVRDISDPESPTVRLNVSAIRDGSYDPTKPPPVLDDAAVSDSTALALERHGGNRIYAVTTTDGRRWDAIVLDGDRQVLGMLQRTWRAMRLRGMDRRSVVSLRQAAERAALLTYAASAAGVRTPKLIGIGEAADSMMLIQEHPTGLRSIRDMRPAEISDAALRDAWVQLAHAHEAGLAHRSITADSILFGPGQGDDQNVWLIGWDNGDVASSELAGRLDLVQLVTVLALKVGPERAIAAARAVLPVTTLAALAPLIQPVAFPGDTRDEAKANKDVIDQTRQALTDLNPSETAAAPFQLVRFGWKTVLIATLAIIAIWVILATTTFDEIVEAVKSANPWWMAISFGLSLATYLGAAMTLKGFFPGRLSLWKAVLTQVAASFAALAAPGGVGPAALNLRLLYRQGAKTSLAVATVALTQVALFFVTILLLVGASLVTGNADLLSSLPSTAILIAVAILAVLALLLLIPKLRAWIWLRIGPTFAQVWPRLVWVLGRPRRLLYALAGTVIQTAGYVAAFWSALQAFDGTKGLSLVTVALIYLLGNSIGSAVPTPGGLGTVEAALTTGLRTAGIATGLAASAALLYRAITYWARVPLGWVAFNHLQKTGDL
ncbi:MAG: flippase-like domain-containing protein [Bifidobacteriaceae bacterium]|nr:flippase-like domain-containing protein [Bifidobacteriaceae bacterium]